jgi:hypothetical protein
MLRSSAIVRLSRKPDGISYYDDAQCGTVRTRAVPQVLLSRDAVVPTLIRAGTRDTLATYRA